MRQDKNELKVMNEFPIPIFFKTNQIVLTKKTNSDWLKDSLNDGAKRNRLLSLKIMYTQSKISMFARFFVNFCLKIMGLLQGNIAGFSVNFLPQNHVHITG